MQLLASLVEAGTDRLKRKYHWIINRHLHSGLGSSDSDSVQNLLSSSRSGVLLRSTSSSASASSSSRGTARAGHGGHGGHGGQLRMGEERPKSVQVSPDLLEKLTTAYHCWI